MYNGVEFLAVLAPEEAARDWLLEVRIRGVVVGRIRQHPVSKSYCYHRITEREGEPFHEEKDLEFLLYRVARQP